MSDYYNNKEAKKFIESMRKDKNVKTDGMTDEEILAQSRFFASGKGTKVEWPDNTDEIEEV